MNLVWHHHESEETKFRSPRNLYYAILDKYPATGFREGQVVAMVEQGHNNLWSNEIWAPGSDYPMNSNRLYTDPNTAMDRAEEEFFRSLQD